MIALARRQPYHSSCPHRELTILVRRDLLDLDQVHSVFLERASNLAVNVKRISHRIVPPNLHCDMPQEARISHPVSQVMRHP